ncbi:MAG: glycosyltransferase family 4 protein [Hyphomicrobiales bacterium]|nr:glycosyltransferase family 4 protein [Hyphomicrobiales bacterium]
MAQDPKIAYVFLRNAHFGPRLASSVELCVRDLILHSRYRGSTLVICPPVDKPFEGVEIATVPGASIGGNFGKAWAVARLLKRRKIDLAIVENHLPAAALIAAASGARVLLHSHAYENAPRGAADRASARLKVAPLSGFAFVSEDCLNQFRSNFPFARKLMRAIPNGLDVNEWSARGPKEQSILSVGRALEDKGHLEAVRAIARTLATRPNWSARFILSAVDREPQTVRALHDAAQASGGRIRVDANLPYDEVKSAWERAAVGMALTKTPEPFGRTALEALASGAALITSGLGGLAEVCGEAAVKVSPQDAGRLAGELGALLDSPDKRAELAKAGRDRAEALFDIGAVAQRMDDFVATLVEGPRQ